MAAKKTRAVSKIAAVLALIGFGLVAYGFYCLRPWLGFIATGFVCMLFAWGMFKADDEAETIAKEVVDGLTAEEDQENVH